MTLPSNKRERPPKRRALAALLSALLALSALVPAVQTASARSTSPLERLSSPAEGVRVDTGRFSLPSDGAFRIGVGVDVKEPTSYLEIRLQIRRPSGRLIFQRTEVRSNVETGTVGVEFARDLSDLDLPPDAYPYTVRVRAQTAEVTERTAEGFLLVHDPHPEVTPVVVGARISTAPRFNAQGDFVTDPARSTVAIESAELLARAVLDDRELKIALAVSPMTLDEWARAAHGYTLSEGDAGLVDIGADEPGPKRYATALATLQEAVATGRLTLLDVGYGDPDPVALNGEGRIGDIAAHYTRGVSAYLATLETTPSTAAAVAYDVLPNEALGVLAQRGHTSVIVAPESLGDDPTVSSGGAFEIDDTTITGFVLNRDACDAIESRDPSAAAFVVFRHAISDRAKSPIVTLTDLGPGRRGSADDVIAFAREMHEAPWSELVVPTALSPDSSAIPIELSASRESSPAAPAGYWEDAVRAQKYAMALQAAAGAADPDARSAVDAALIAQSSRWAGPDNSWSQADRGRSFASHAERVSRDVLDKVRIAAKDVTLSGPKGDLPISISNGSAKDLQVELVMSGQNLDLPNGRKESLTLEPQENFHTVAIDLGSALSGRLTVEAWAGEVLLSQGTSIVRASYLDRLVIIGAVTILLVGLLVFIRKRVTATDAGTIPDDDVLRHEKGGRP